MGEVIKAFKGFNEDMTCTPCHNVRFQYEEGKEYEEESAEACACGFHACEYPLDVFSHYPPNKSVYHEVVLQERWTSLKETRFVPRISRSEFV